MIRKDLANQRVVKAISVGLLAVMATTSPMATLAENSQPIIDAEEKLEHF